MEREKFSCVLPGGQRETLAALDKGDLGTLDQLAMNRTFATRDNELLKDHPELFAVNVLTQIDKLGKKYDIPVRDNYDSMSERCHTNSAGHHQLYSTIDKSNGTVTYSDLKNPEMCLAFIHAPLGLIFLFEQAMNELDSITLRVADLHHRVHPRGGLIIAAANEDNENPEHLNNSNFRHQARAVEILGFALACSPSSLDLPVTAHTAVGPQDAAVVGTSRHGAVGAIASLFFGALPGAGGNN